MIENFDNYLFRCSALGKIISKSGKLTQGVETYLNDVFVGEMYGIKKDITSKYLEKGTACEQEGFDILNKAMFPNRFVTSYKKHLSNDFIKGTPDTLVDDIVFDIKNAWDLFTFGKATLTHDYEWQLKGYMWLTGAKGASLFYVISDMPDVLLADEERKLFYQGKFLSTESVDYLEACEELRKKHNYSHMKLAERFKKWDICDPEYKTIISSVNVAREYLNTLLYEFKRNLETNEALICASSFKAKQ